MQNNSTPPISVIVPTYNRSHYHERLYACFSKQTYPNKELIILDDSPEPSPFFSDLQDPRVRYTHSSSRKTIGEKRNLLIKVAEGEIIAHFDDDDLYTSSYLEVMGKFLLMQNSDLVKLAGWFAYHEPSRNFFYWDTRVTSPSHFLVSKNQEVLSIPGSPHFYEGFLFDTLWGFGFSYVYHKSVAQNIAFDPKKNFGEDIDFCKRVHTSGGCCKAFLDTDGISVHEIHTSNTSRIFPQFMIPSFIMQKFFTELQTLII